MCPNYHMMMTVRAEIYDFTYTYEFSYFSFAMAKPSQEPRWQSLYYPLAHQVWLAVLAALFCVPTIYNSVNNDFVIKYFIYVNILKVQHLCEFHLNFILNSVNHQFSFIKCYIHQIEFVRRRICGDQNAVGVVFQGMTGVLLGQSLPYRLTTAYSSRVLMAAWIIFAFIFGAAYRGNLTASLTLPKYPPRPETLPQLVDSVDRLSNVYRNK